jgi:hypothetical protein
MQLGHMPLLHVPAVLLLVLSAIAGQGAPPKAECRAWQECRQLAVDAAARQDFEGFHDLAWRAVQLGPKNDPALMYLLARAQSVSGRPTDAIVMLERLAGMGVPIVDAATSDDFRRVRALPRWPDLAGKLSPENGDTHLNAKSLIPETPKNKDALAVTKEPLPASAPKVDASPANASTAPKAEVSPVNTTPPPKVEAASPPKEAAAPVSSALESLRFATPQFTPAGLAYDAVSRRFVVGDRLGRKLAVVDEFSRHVANLAGAQSSGFGEIAALEIDTRQGYLWVVSSEGTKTSLHKLQLISGRLLTAYPVPDTFAPVSLGDVAVAGGGVVLALDTAGHRLFTLAARGGAAEVAVTLPDTSPSSIAPGVDGVVYVATASGIDRVDIAARSTSPVKEAKGIDVSGLTRIRWHRGALAGIQKTSEGPYRAVRITLDRLGRRATALDVLDPSISIANPTAATIVGGVLYYLANGNGSEMVVRRVTLH